MNAGSRLGRALNAGDRFQVFIDRLKIMVRPILVRGPRHHLKQSAVERRVEAVRGDGGGAVRMEVIVVRTVSDRLEEFCERGPSLWKATLVGRQVAGHDVWRDGA